MEDLKGFNEFFKTNTQSSRELTSDNDIRNIIHTIIDIPTTEEVTVLENTKQDNVTVETLVEKVLIEPNNEILEKETVIDNSISIESDNGYYKIFKDKPESFNCEIEVEGVDLKSTKVRLMFETKDWNIFIDGEIDGDGNVSIPIKKMSIFTEGTKGKIYMEVIADSTVFIPWEDEFEVKMSKKVTMKFNESKTLQESTRKSITIK